MRNDEQYRFNGAQSTSFVTKYGNSIARVNSKKSLNGKINILLQKIDKNKQNLKVNVRYILQTQNEYKVLYPRETKYDSWTIGFDSKNKGYSQVGLTQCQSRGILEKQILNYID